MHQMQIRRKKRCICFACLICIFIRIYDTYKKIIFHILNQQTSDVSNRTNISLMYNTTLSLSVNVICPTPTPAAVWQIAYASAQRGRIIITSAGDDRHIFMGLETVLVIRILQILVQLYEFVLRGITHICSQVYWFQLALYIRSTLTTNCTYSYRR